MSMTIREMAQAAGAELILPEAAQQNTADREVPLVCHDSRDVIPGSLFVCIRGEHSDGNDFAAPAVQSGAEAPLAERSPFDDLPPVPLLLAEARDSVRALGRMGTAWRKRYSGPVVGITGTAGKRRSRKYSRTH